MKSHDLFCYTPFHTSRHKVLQKEKKPKPAFFFYLQRFQNQLAISSTSNWLL